MQILKFENVGLTYFSDNGETEAIKDLNFDVNSGDFVSLVGPSGCGKTTILSLISGLIKPTKGTITHNCNKNTFVGYMFQKDNLFEWRTILGNVYLGLVHRLDRPTGGVMVFAKTSKSASRLSQQIIEKNFEKEYLCIVDGKM